jgi:hypothetical protein
VYRAVASGVNKPPPRYREQAIAYTDGLEPEFEMLLSIKSLLPAEIAVEFSSKLLEEIAVAALSTALLYWLYRRYPASSAKVVEAFQASTSHVTLYVVAAMLFPLVLRLAILPWAPPPYPHIHDEFSHLLVADTLLRGHLTNPPHPLWRHFETIYVLQQPTYASNYPIGQGVILAAGKLLVGNPWAGVLLASVLMCGSISWMLYGCLPPCWAAIGGLIAAARIAMQWEDTYYGGAFCAFGGALLFGALCRLRSSPSKWMGLLAGLGWSIVWFTRPFESLPLLLFELAFIAIFSAGNPRQWRPWLWPVLLALAIQLSAGVLTALHDRAVTGSYTTTPYQLSQQLYGTPQTFLWQAPLKEPLLRTKELRDMYAWQREKKDRTSKHPMRNYRSILYYAWAFFVSVWYYIPIALLPFLWKDREVLAATAMIALAIAVSGLYPFFFAHYVAAYVCLFFFLVMRGLMLLFEWKPRGIALGRLVGVFLIAGSLVMGLRIVPFKTVLGRVSIAPPKFRKQISERLLRLGGRHVVFVKYGVHHDFQDEWVYNTADVDGSPIVWCRAMGRDDDLEVARYYAGRSTWMVEVDPGNAQVFSYQPTVKSGAFATPGE